MNQRDVNLGTQVNLSINERRVLEVIWRSGPIARADIVSQTALTAASVTRLTRDLADRGLITESVKREGLRGQPSRPLKIHAEGAYAAGINFSHRHMQVGVVDLSGQLLFESSRPLPNPEPAVIADTAWSSLNVLLKENAVPYDRLVGVGISLPGDFLADATLQVHAFFPGLAKRDLYSEFSARIPAQIYLENDSTAAALGERILGAGRDYTSFIFVHIGHGVGGGIVLDGKPYRGEHGNAALLGVLFPNDLPRPSGQDLLESLATEGTEVNDFQQLMEVDVTECPPLQNWLERAGNQLRIGIYTASRIIDPAAVIIGGRLPVHLLERLVSISTTGSFAPPHDQLPQPKIVASALGPRAGLIGAAMLPLYQTFLRG